MAYTTTIFPTYVPQGFFDNDNVLYIQNKIIELLLFEFSKKIIIDIPSIIRVMQRVLEERLETIPKMNQRVIMYIMNEFRNHQLEINKVMNWEENYTASQKLYDPIAQSSHKPINIKLANRLGKQRVGGTLNFYYT